MFEERLQKLILIIVTLARLLKIDMNTLFSFQEDLTELEISMFINEITESAVTGNIVSAFERTAEKIREYPHCDRLIYLAATVLNSSLALSAIDPEQKTEYKKMVNSWYEQVSGSQDEKSDMRLFMRSPWKRSMILIMRKQRNEWNSSRMLSLTKSCYK